MEARVTSISNAVWYGKGILLAQFSPITLMAMRQYEDYLYGSIARMKSVKRAH